jgi:hypothetical protein
MNIQQRIDLLVQLGEYMQGDSDEWAAAKQKAFQENNWFIPEFVEQAVANIAHNFLQRDILEAFVAQYHLAEPQGHPQKVGVVLAGNIPLVGFHDVLCVFLTGHYALIKPSSRDEAMIKHLVEKMQAWQPDALDYFTLRSLLKGCDAYIATGSNNTSRYFEYYFRNYPTIIRRNRTSVAVLTGAETTEELEALAEDIYQYFGLGCRNVTKLYVPRGYNFEPLLKAGSKFNYLINHHKYKNNYDYNLTAHILNNRYYMTNSIILLVEDPSPFSPISQVHYEYYDDLKSVQQSITDNESIQCVVGSQHTPFGQAQCPNIATFADGVDTVAFLKSLS